MGLITNNDETAYREEVRCQENNLSLNVNGSAVEKVESFKFLSVHITDLNGPPIQTVW